MTIKEKSHICKTETSSAKKLVCPPSLLKKGYLKILGRLIWSHFFNVCTQRFHIENNGRISERTFHFVLYQGKKKDMELNKYYLKMIPSNSFKWCQGQSKSQIQIAYLHGGNY